MSLLPAITCSTCKAAFVPESTHQTLCQGCIRSGQCSITCVHCGGVFTAHAREVNKKCPHCSKQQVEFDLNFHCNFITRMVHRLLAHDEDHAVLEIASQDILESVTALRNKITELEKNLDSERSNTLMLNASVTSAHERHESLELELASLKQNAKIMSAAHESVPQSKTLYGPFMSGLANDTTATSEDESTDHVLALNRRITDLESENKALLTEALRTDGVIKDLTQKNDQFVRAMFSAGQEAAEQQEKIRKLEAELKDWNRVDDRVDDLPESFEEFLDDELYEDSAPTLKHPLRGLRAQRRLAASKLLQVAWQTGFYYGKTGKEQKPSEFRTPRFYTHHEFITVVAHRDQLQRQVDEQCKKLDAHEAEVDQLNHEIGELNCTIKSRDNEIALLRQQLDEKQNASSGRRKVAPPSPPFKTVGTFLQTPTMSEDIERLRGLVDTMLTGLNVLSRVVDKIFVDKTAAPDPRIEELETELELARNPSLECLAKLIMARGSQVRFHTGKFRKPIGEARPATVKEYAIQEDRGMLVFKCEEIPPLTGVDESVDSYTNQIWTNA